MMVRAVRRSKEAQTRPPPCFRARSTSNGFLVDLIRRAICESDDGPKRAASRPIRASRCRGHAISHSVQPGNGLVRHVPDPGFRGALSPAFGVERAAGDERSVVRPLVADRPHGWILA